METATALVSRHVHHPEVAIGESLTLKISTPEKRNDDKLLIEERLVSHE